MNFWLVERRHHIFCWKIFSLNCNSLLGASSSVLLFTILPKIICILTKYTIKQPYLSGAYSIWSVILSPMFNCINHVLLYMALFWLKELIFPGHCKHYFIASWLFLLACVYRSLSLLTVGVYRALMNMLQVELEYHNI